MKVFVVYDPLYEHVMSVHRTSEGADKRCVELDGCDALGKNREPTDTYLHTSIELELED